MLGNREDQRPRRCCLLQRWFGARLSALRVLTFDQPNVLRTSVLHEETLYPRGCHDTRPKRFWTRTIVPLSKPDGAARFRMFSGKKVTLPRLLRTTIPRPYSWDPTRGVRKRLPCSSNFVLCDLTMLLDANKQSFRKHVDAEAEIRCNGS
jgi:hypothetical protein